MKSINFITVILLLLSCSFLWGRFIPQKDKISLWLDAADMQSLELSKSGKVEAWFSKHDRDFEVFSLLEETQPKFLKRGFNGKPAVYFNPEVQHFLKSDTNMDFNEEAYTAFFVFQNETVSLDHNACLFCIIGLETNPTIQLHTRENGHLRMMELHMEDSGNSGYYSSYLNDVLEEPILAVAAFDMKAGTKTFETETVGFANEGMDIYEQSSTPILGGSGVVIIGCQKINVGEAPAHRSFGGYLAEMIFYTTKLSEREIETVRNYLKNKWEL